MLNIMCDHNSQNQSNINKCLHWTSSGNILLTVVPTILDACNILNIMAIMYVFLTVEKN